MSNYTEKQPYKLIPYPGKKYLGIGLLALIAGIIIMGISDFTFFPEKDMLWHIKSTIPLIIMIMQFYIFSCEKEEDERVRLIRYKTIFGAINLGFIVFLSQVYMYLSDDMPDFFILACIAVIFTQVFYLIKFRANLKKDPDWIYKDTAQKTDKPFSKFRLIMFVPLVIITYYLGIYIVGALV